MAVVHNASATFALTSGTTGGTITIPPGVLDDDDLYILIESADHTIGTALCSVTDSEPGGNTWANLGASSDRKLQLFWKKATSASASVGVTITGGVGSTTGGLSAFTGAAAGDPTTDIVFELNASGNETHAGFTPSFADSMICFGIGNNVDDIVGMTPTTMACTDPGDLEPELWARGSSGGGDCQAIFAARVQVGGPTATGSFTWAQDDSTTQSVTFAIKPAGGGALPKT